MAEMARDLLAGRTDLRALAQSSAYTEHFMSGINGYAERQERLTPEERQDFMEKAQEAIYGAETSGPRGEESR